MNDFIAGTIVGSIITIGALVTVTGILMTLANHDKDGER